MEKFTGELEFIKKKNKCTFQNQMKLRALQMGLTRDTIEVSELQDRSIKKIQTTAEG